MCSTDQTRPAGIWELASRQHGVVTHRQLVERGLSRRAIQHRVRRGRLHRVRRGVYAVGRAELSDEGRWMAVVLASGPGASLSHVSAAGLWGIAAELGRGLDSAALGAPEVTVPPTRRPRPAGIRVHRRALDARDFTRRKQIRVTSPVRTLLDLAVRFPEPRLEAVVIAADKLDLVRAESLRTEAERRAGEPGARALCRVLDRGTFARTDSELERRFLPLARRAGLPLPETGAVLHGHRVDFLWRDLGLVVETDGLRYHRTSTQQARDRRRDQVLAAAGLTPLRFTYAQVVRRPTEVEETLRSVAGLLRGGSSSRRTRGRSR